MVCRVVISALQVVEAGFGVVDVAAVAQGVAADEAGRGGSPSGGGIRGHVAPRIVGVACDFLIFKAGDIGDQLDDIALEIEDIVIGRKAAATVGLGAVEKLPIGQGHAPALQGRLL